MQVITTLVFVLVGLKLYLNSWLLTWLYDFFFYVGIKGGMTSTLLKRIGIQMKNK